MGQWRAHVADTVTGQVLADVEVAGQPQFSRAINDKGSWSVDVVVDERANRAVDLHTYVTPARFSWLVTYDGYPVQGGPVWTHQFSESDRTLSVSGSGIGGMFSRRVLRKAGEHPSTITQPSNDLVYNGLSLRGIMRQLVADNMSQVGFGLPIDLPDAETGTATRTYYGYDLAMVWDRMTDLAEVINGPEVEFAPTLSADGATLRWRMDIGNPLLGDQDTPAVWDYGGALSSIDVDVNGAEQPTSRVFVKGSGQERALLVGFAQDTRFAEWGYPGLDYVDSDHLSVVEQATLNGYADQDLKDLSAPVETWTCSVRIDGMTTGGVEVAPRLGTWSLGDAPVFGVHGHPWIADGSYRRRVLGYTSAEVDTVALTLGELHETPVSSTREV